MSASSCLGCKNASIKGSRVNEHGQHEDEMLDQRDDQSTEERPLDPQTKLMNTAAKGVKAPTFLQWLEQGKISPAAKDEQGRTAIQHIIYNGTTAGELKTFLQQLKQQFPDQEIADQEVAEILNTPDNLPRPSTAFIGAVERMGEKRDKEPIELVDILFENGAKPSLAERKRSLLYCIKLSDLETSETHSGIELFKHLAQKFQALKMPLDQATALAVAGAATLAGNDDLMQYILEHPAIFPIDAASEGEKGNTLLHAAAIGGKNSTHVIDLLLAKFSSPADYIDRVNKKGETALHVGVKHGSLDAVRALVKAGANIHLKAQDGNTPLDMVNGLIEQEPTDVLRAIKRILQLAANRSDAIN